jgi:hypothetical protein
VLGRYTKAGLLVAAAVLLVVKGIFVYRWYERSQGASGAASGDRDPSLPAVRTIGSVGGWPTCGFGGRPRPERKGSVAFKDPRAFSGFSVNGVREVRRFYGETLRMSVSEESEPMSMLELRVAGGQNALVYAKPDHVPASSTVLNSQGDDPEEAVDVLAGRGVRFERYEGAEQDQRGTFRGGGPPIT